MENNSEMHGDFRVEERLATLTHDNEWQPDTDRGFARLVRRHNDGKGRGRRWTLAAAAGMAACIGLMAFPTPRALAQRCLDCSAALWQGLASSVPVQAHVKPEKDRQMAPDFALKDTSGRTVRLSDFKGRVVLLNFWATWCGGCKVEIPWFIDFQRAYRDRGLVVLGVSLDEDGWKSVKPFMNAKKINYRVMIGGSGIANLYGIQAMPVTLTIDRSGRIAAKHVGVVSKSDYQAEIETLLSGIKPAFP